MFNTEGHRRTTAIATAAVATVAVLGGTTYAAARPSHHPAVSAHHAKPVSKSSVKKLIKSYVKKHAADLTGPPGAPGSPGGPGPAGPGAIPFAIGTTSASSATHSLKTFGLWHAAVTCSSTGVGVAIVGPGTSFGTNTVASNNGAAGASYETSGPPGGVFGIGQGGQGSATVIVKDGQAAYSVTYFANASTGATVHCDVIGDAIKL